MNFAEILLNHEQYTSVSLHAKELGFTKFDLLSTIRALSSGSSTAHTLSSRRQSPAVRQVRENDAETALESRFLLRYLPWIASLHLQVVRLNTMNVSLTNNIQLFFVIFFRLIPCRSTC